MAARNSRRADLLEFDTPISVLGAELQEVVLAAELPSDCSLAVLRAYRLTLAWLRGPEAMSQLADVKGLAEWEYEALGRLKSNMELWAPIAVIAGEMQDPAAADAEHMAHSLLLLCEWALSVGARASALLLMETAALASPFNARRAYLAGRFLRDRGRPAEAERWLNRSVRLAVATRDREAHALAAAALRGITGAAGEH